MESEATGSQLREKLKDMFLILRESTRKMRSFEDLELVFRQTIKKLKKVLFHFESDLVSLTDFVVNYFDRDINAEDRIVLLVAVKSIATFAEEIELFATKNALASTIKVFLAAELSKLAARSDVCACLHALYLLNAGFSVWRKTRDHVPELYFTLQRMLAFIEAQLSGLRGSLSEDSAHQSREAGRSQVGEEIYTSLFSRFVLQGEGVPADEGGARRVYEDLLFILVLYIKNSFKLTNMDLNFDVLYEPIRSQLAKFPPLIAGNKFYSAQLGDVIEKLDGWFKDYKLKPALDLIPDKPLIKIKQLTPKIRETSKPTLIQERQKLRKKIRREKNLAIKEIKQDQSIVDDDRNKLEDHLKKNRDKSRKRVIQIMEQQSKEVKRIESMQRPQNLKRFKRKNNRLAGNKVSNTKHK